MKINRVKIQNYRAIREFDQKFDSVTSFIGYNGGGKSSILKAVEWFFEDFALQETDYFTPNGEAERAMNIEVEVTFDDLSSGDRKNFGMYARGNEMTLRRKITRGGASKLYGRAVVCLDFDVVRATSAIGEKRKQLKILAQEEKYATLLLDGSPKKDEIEEALTQWEEDPKNAHFLTEKAPEEANHFFGAVGSNKLKNDSGFIFVPAAPDLTGQFDSSNKGSAIELLVGNLMKDAVGGSVEKWQVENKAILDELEGEVKKAANNGLEEQSSRVNAHLESYLPGASFRLDVSLDDWKPKATPVAQPSIGRSGQEFLIETQGHGIQRATLLALLQVIAENRADNSSDHGPEEVDASTLIICIEEPEVYQHPVQARMLAASFKLAAELGNIQFIFATHSPYFVDPAFLRSTYRVIPNRDGSNILGADPTDYFMKKNQFGELEKYFSKATIEGLFSRACLLVEGDTDRLVFEGLRSSVSGRTLAEHGITVIDVEGGNNLWAVASIVTSYGVPVYLLHDGDCDEVRARARASNQHKNADLDVVEEKTQQILTSWKNGVDQFVAQAQKQHFGTGFESFVWGSGSCIGDHCAVLCNDLEAELLEWPSFVEKAKENNLGEDLRATKKAGSYARAVADADMSDCPKTLVQILEAVIQIGEGAKVPS